MHKHRLWISIELSTEKLPKILVLVKFCIFFTHIQPTYPHSSIFTSTRNAFLSLLADFLKSFSHPAPEVRLAPSAANSRLSGGIHRLEATAKRPIRPELLESRFFIQNLWKELAAPLFQKTCRFAGGWHFCKNGSSTLLAQRRWRCRF